MINNNSKSFEFENFNFNIVGNPIDISKKHIMHPLFSFKIASSGSVIKNRSIQGFYSVANSFSMTNLSKSQYKGYKKITMNDGKTIIYLKEKTLETYKISICNDLYKSEMNEYFVECFSSLLMELRKKGGVHEKGIFRISGDEDAVTHLKGEIFQKLNLKEEIDYELLLEKYTAHDIASLLKGLLKSLQQPIIDFTLRNQILHHLPEDLQEVYQQIKNLTKYQKAILFQVMNVCKLINQNKTINQMDNDNLVKVLVRNLFHEEEEPNPVRYLSLQAEINNAAKKLLDNYDDILSELHKMSPNVHLDEDKN